jgi:hypothetical protein
VKTGDRPLEIQYEEGGIAGIAILAVLGGILVLISTFFWMVVGWRAMIAHEKLAASTQELATKRNDGDEAT